MKAVFHAEITVESSSYIAPFKMYGRPYFLNGKKAAFLLVVRAYDAVGTVAAIGVHFPVFIAAHHAFVGIVPQKPSGRKWITPHLFPVVFQSGAVPAVIHAVEKFGWHHNVVT